MRLLFFLGRSHDLCLAELIVVLSRMGATPPVLLSEGLYESTVPENVSADLLMDVLGGVRKIAVIEQEISSAEDPKEAVLTILRTKAIDNKIYFSVTWLGSQEKPRIFEFKKMLDEHMIRARFAEPDNLGGVDAALLSHKKDLVEVFAIPTEVGWTVARTLAVQNIDAWSDRDFGKPYRDAKKGMLPPKVARMMVNLGIGTKHSAGLKVADPFCGSGTVLMESAMLDCIVIGSDQAPESVHGSGQNLHWLEERTGKKIQSRLSIQDATQLSEKETGGLLDMIVTEPFLGKPTPRADEISHIALGIEKLLLGAMKKWRSILKPNASVVIIFPQWVNGKSVKNLHALVDRLGSLGYNRENGPLVYSRPQTQVQREVYVFTYKG